MAESPSALIAKLERRRALLAEIVSGLRGQPFHWGEGESSSKQGMLAPAFGVTLLTRIGVGRAGLDLKRGAKPVGAIYFGAPIQRTSDVFVMQCQTKPIEDRK